MQSDALCRGIHTNFSVKIYQLLKKFILNVHILFKEMSICSFHTTCLTSIPTCASTTMALALHFVKHVIRQCVCVCMCNYDHVQEYHSMPKILR